MSDSRVIRRFIAIAVGWTLALLCGCAVSEADVEGGLDEPCYENATCRGALVCEEGMCVVPVAEARGGSGMPCYPNGTCDAGYACHDDACVVDACSEDDECAAPECVPSCAGRACGVDPVCGEPCGPDCEDGEVCTALGHCVDPACAPMCDGRVCGLDPVCGVPCGPGCGDGSSCNADGQCVDPACAPVCDARMCGLDPVCGVPCGPGCGDGSSCNADGQCVDAVCEPDCGDRVCGPDPVCGQPCGPGCADGTFCDAHGACDDGGCVAQCDARECGPDPVCGEPCGADCGVSASCDASGHCEPTPCTAGCGETVEIAIVFLSTNFEFTTPVDVILNGVRHHFYGRATLDDPIWDVSVTVDGVVRPARGHVLTLDQHLVSVEFDLDQVHFPGAPRGGFGNFSYKILKRHPATNLHALNNDPDSLEYWAGVIDETGILQVYGDPVFPSPTFPTFVLGVTNMDVGMNQPVANWNTSGKFVIVIGNVGDI